METVSTYKKFGRVLKDLIDVVENTNDWDKYVDDKTKVLINELLEIQNLNVIIDKHDIPYTTLRSKYSQALDRIKEKNTRFTRNGKSEKAQYLLNLVDSIPNWKEALTNKEIQYVDTFKEKKNFYEVARILDAKPGNVAGKLYGTNQRAGVIQKLERFKESVRH